MSTGSANLVDFRVEKQRVDGILLLSNGRSAVGCFFIACGSARHYGRERVGELLNSESGFFPFEVHDGSRVSTVLFNRAHVVTVTLAENEARREPGYSVAPRREVSLLMDTGQRVVGVIRVYRPENHSRLSDWAHDEARFRYIETAEETVIVNSDHVVEAHEVER